MPRRDLKDMVGYRTGSVVVLEYADQKQWLVRCDCGQQRLIDGADLRRRTYRCDHDPAVRFSRMYDKANDCWLWTGSLTKDGYGHFRAYGRIVLAHRFAWESKYGSIPKHLEIDHLCRIRNCVNPNHLEAVPHVVNVRRGDLGRVTRERFRLRREIK